MTRKGEPTGGRYPPTGSLSPKAAVALTVVTNYGILLIGVGTSIIAARLLGPRGRGELAAIQLWPQQLSSIALLGLPEALIYYSSRWASDLGRAMATAAAIIFAGALGLSAIGFLAMPLLLRSQPPDVVAASRLYLLAVFLVAATLPIHVLRGMSQFLKWNIMRALAPIAWLAVLTTAAVMSIHDPVLITRANLFAMAAVCIVYAAIAKWTIRGPFRPRRKDVKPLLGYGLPNILAVLPQTLNLRMDQMILAAFLPADRLGLYVAAVAWSGAITPAVAAIAHVNFPRIADLSNADRVGVLNRGVRMSVLVGLVAGLSLAIVTPLVLPRAFGSAFEPTIPVALIMIAASVVAGSNFVLQDSLRGLGQLRPVLFSEVAGLMVTGAALLVLLPRFGLVGAASASVLGYSTVLVVLVRLTSKSTGVSALQLVVPTPSEVRVLGRALRSALSLAARLTRRKK